MSYKRTCVLQIVNVLVYKPRRISVCYCLSIHTLEHLLIFHILKQRLNRYVGSPWRAQSCAQFGICEIMSHLGASPLGDVNCCTMSSIFGELGERRKSRECARAQRFVCSKAGLGQWFPKWDVCDQSLRCQGEMIFVISLLSFTFFLFGSMFYNYINIHTLLSHYLLLGCLRKVEGLLV